MARLKKNINPKMIGLVVLIIGSALLVIFLVFNSSSKTEQISEDQIRVSRGDKTVIVNRSGRVEYKSSDGVFYEFWDETRVSNFFSYTEARAREYLANPQARTENSYEIILWLDGEIVTIYITDDPFYEEIFEELEDLVNGGDGDIGEYFDNEDESGGGGSDGGTTGPTPTTVILPDGNILTPTVVGGGGGGETVQIPPDCDLYNQLVNDRTVISNTICQTGEE